MQNRDGKTISAQVSRMGNIDLANGFMLEGQPFQLKNDHETPITLTVLPYGNHNPDNPDEGWITTTFAYGWNPEILVAVKASSQSADLKWGY